MDTINNNLNEEQLAGIEAQDVTQQNVVDVNVLEASPTPIPEQPVSNNASGRVLSLAESGIEARKQEKAQAEIARKEAIELQKEVNNSENLIRTLGGKTLGRGEAQTKAIEDAGLNKKQTSIDNLDNQILALTTSIAKQEVQDGLQVLQLAGRGLGIPAGIVRGQQALLAGQLKAKRDSSSIDLANKIATSALLQGKVDDAKTAIEESIKLQFEDKEAELALEIQFLNRTDTKLAKAKETELAEIQNKKEEALQVFNIQAQVAQAGGSQAEIQAVGKATTSTEALSLAPSLGRAAKLDQALKNAQISNQYSQIRERKNAEKAANEAAKKGILTKGQLETATDLRKEVNGLAEVKATKELEVNIVGLMTSLSKENGFGDISSINSFQRLAVDPGVAVREGDVALLQSAQSYGDKSWLKAQGLIKGDKLTNEAREQMRDLALDIYQARVEFTDENIQPIKTVASESGIDYDKYIGKTFATKEDIQARFASPEVKENNYVNEVNTILNSINSIDTTLEPITNSSFNALFQ